MLSHVGQERGNGGDIEEVGKGQLGRGFMVLGFHLD